MQLKEERKQERELENLKNSKIIIKRIPRTKHKHVVAIANLEVLGPDVDLKKTAKVFASKFATGSSVSKNAEKKDEIVIQGDVATEVEEYLTGLMKDKGLDIKIEHVTERLILEPTVAPVIVPIFTDGFEKIKPEEVDMKTDYMTPNNVGAQITVNIGKAIDDNIISKFRSEWKELCLKYTNKENPNDLSEELMFGKEARELRSRVCAFLREQVAKLRLENGFEEEDPRFKDVDFWTRFTKSRGASDPDIQFVGLNWAIKEYQKHVKVYDSKGNVIGERESERPEGL
ncbi:hypothetical protein PMKS-001405 [Pichia membranifaciens]|uniref:Translation machinery-associated protein 22 n=1 Tax=Pichia membranifaciens TaxID=4926 RepID=A0A1Q2YEE7_9ASCO|nr:hypothetical protein PMKS-001405 [Pichia membranifaciens]